MPTLIKGITLLTALLFPLLAHSQDWVTLLAEFEQYAEESRISTQAVGMSVAIVKDGKMVYAKGFGIRGQNDPRPVTPETLFQIGSMSKSFTTTLTAIAVDRKLLKWDDPVINRMPSFLVYDPWVARAFQIEDLFAQRSGLVPYAGDNQAVLGFPIDQMIANVRYFKPVTSFRSSYAYQNIFFSIGAEILSNVTGKSFLSLLKDELFLPLNMKASSADLSSYLKAPNRAGWHQLLPSGSVEFIPETFESANAPYTYAPAGGVNSTVLDMSNWLIMQADRGLFQGRKIVSNENLSRTHLANIYTGKIEEMDTYYCLGWELQEYSPYPIIRHDGGTFGASNSMGIVPEDRLGIVILCNTKQSLLADILIMKFFDLYYKKPKIDRAKKMLESQKEIQNQAMAENVPIANPLPSLPLTAYIGTYFNPVYGDMIVSVKGDELVAEIGPKKIQWVFKHYNRDTFSLWWPYVEMGASKVLFYMNAQNKPGQVFIELLSAEGQGLFEKKN